MTQPPGTIPTPAHRTGPPSPGASDATDVLLRDGSVARIRPLVPADRDALLALHGSLSPASAYLRFFGASRIAAPQYVTKLVRPGAADHDALVLEHHRLLVAVVSYECTGAEAEIAFVVADDEHGNGIATLLLEHLASRARRAGVTRFVANTLSDNHRMAEVLTDVGFAVHRGFSSGCCVYELDLRPGERLRRDEDEREAVAEVASLSRLLCPRSVAVIGASERPHAVGSAVLSSLLKAGFDRPIYPVNTRGGTIQGLVAHRSLDDVPSGVDLVVAAVPADQVLTVADDCERTSAGALVVLSAGFADAGPEGAARERALRETTARAGIRLVGPNCLGVVNTSSHLAATFAPALPPPGRVGVLTQSGGFGIAVLEQLRTTGLGVSSFVSVGNKADVSANDLLLWWEQDAGTDVVVLYLESFGNPRRFARIARMVSGSKPVVAIMAGRTAVGARAARSHTAAAATPARSVEALFRQAGVIAVQHMQELADVVTLLATQPLPGGRRVAVVGNAGGPGILAADAAAEAGLELPRLQPDTQDRLRSLLPAGAAITNPVDTIASADGEQLAGAVRAVLDDPGIDALLTILTPTLLTEPDELANAVVIEAAGSTKPVLLTLIGSPVATGVRTESDGDGIRALPCYAFPESALTALRHAVDYADVRRRPAGTIPAQDPVALQAAREVVNSALRRDADGCWLTPTEADRLLTAYGVPVLGGIQVSSPSAAATATRRLGTPVALKAVGPDLVHKTDIGGITLGVRNAAEAARAYLAMSERVGLAMRSALVQPMSPAGPELVIGLTNDSALGPLIMFGLGGVLADLLGDEALRLLPLTDLDAHDLVRSIRGLPLLTGYRGSPPSDLPALERLLVDVSRLGEDLPEVVELDLNPVRAHPEGIVVLDAKVHVRPAPPVPDPYARRLH